MSPPRPDDRTPPPERSAAGRQARRLGRRGERAAARQLKRGGYRILARNLRTPAGEIDILAEEGGALVIVEVKTTSRPRSAAAEPPLRHGQRRRLRAAATWLRRRARPRTVRVRLDVALVTLDAGRFVVTIRRDAVWS